MGHRIEAKFEYEGLELTCDDEVIARVYECVCKDVSVAEVLDLTSRPRTVQFISIHRPRHQSTKPRFRWTEVIGMILAASFNLLVFVVGIVTIYQWIVRQIA